MRIPWSLKGAFLHNLFVGMNLVPLLHRDLPLASRCEIGVSSFVGLDLMRMLAEILGKKLGAPTGSTFMASQTTGNLQAACLSGILVAVTKDVHFNPWQFGQVRLSELPIEEHFSFCRRQSANSQLSARAFWQAAARVSLRNGKLLSQESAPKVTGEKPLTNAELLEVLITLTPFLCIL